MRTDLWRDTYRSDNIVIQNSVINNGDGMTTSEVCMEMMLTEFGF